VQEGGLLRIEEAKLPLNLRTFLPNFRKKSLILDCEFVFSPIFHRIPSIYIHLILGQSSVDGKKEINQSIMQNHSSVVRID
jgi:hypothetical protein